jgi:hypothetical protein
MHAHGQTKDEQQGEHQAAKTDLINAVEQVDTNRDTNDGWDHIETGKLRHFTSQQTGPRLRPCATA